MRLAGLYERMTLLVVSASDNAGIGVQNKAFVIPSYCPVGCLGSSCFTDDQLRNDLRRWLSAPDPWINHNIACKAHHSGTATWFMDNNLFFERTGSHLGIYGLRTHLSFASFPTTDSLRFRSGIRENHPLVMHYHRLFSLWCTHLVDQFHNHRIRP